MVTTCEGDDEREDEKQAIRRADQPSGLNTSRVGVSKKFEKGNQKNGRKSDDGTKIAVVRVANSQKNDLFSVQIHSPDERTGHHLPSGSTRRNGFCRA